MKRRSVTSVAGLVLLAAVFVSPAAAAPSGSGRVNVSVVPRSKVVFSIVDQDHIDLRTNAPWRLTLRASTGTETLVGASTAGTPVRLTIPSGTQAWWVDVDTGNQK